MLCESHHELAHVYEKSGDYGAFRRKGTLVRATEAMITDVRAGLVPVPVGRPASPYPCREDGIGPAGEADRV